MAKRYYDGGMISQPKNDLANMPQQVIIKKYPSGSGYLPENLNDTISGIDSQMGKDNAKKTGNLQPEKY
jgi:hypothetical protein